MPYMGNTTRKASDIRRFDVTGSTSATHTLTWTAPNEQSLIVTINGVKQHEDAYSVSGTTLTLTSALVSADKLEVIGINDVGTTITPAQNSVTADTIADGVITNAKIDASAAIATSKISGLAASATTDTTDASNIASGTLATARLGSGTADATTFLRGDNSWAEAGGGKIGQVLFGSVTSSGGSTVTTSAFADSTLNVTITPAATSSKIILMLCGADWDSASTDDRGLSYKFYKNVGGAGDAAIDESQVDDDPVTGFASTPYSRVYIDSPSTTSAVEYSLYVQAIGNTVYYFRDGKTYQLIAMEVLA